MIILSSCISVSKLVVGVQLVLSIDFLANIPTHINIIYEASCSLAHSK